MPEQPRQVKDKTARGRDSQITHPTPCLHAVVGVLPLGWVTRAQLRSDTPPAWWDGMGVWGRGRSPAALLPGSSACRRLKRRVRRALGWPCSAAQHKPRGQRWTLLSSGLSLVKQQSSPQQQARCKLLGFAVCSLPLCLPSWKHLTWGVSVQQH